MDFCGCDHWTHSRISFADLSLGDLRLKTSLTDCREIETGVALQPFFITGLPRSRTAWLANLLTTDTTICYHDQPFDMDKVENGKVVGFSGPQVCLQFDEVRWIFPSAPWLIVLRDQSEALASFQRLVPVIGVPGAYWEGRCQLITDLCSRWQARTVAFNALDDETEMRLVWAHLLPGIPFDAQRFELLKSFNVQQKI